MLRSERAATRVASLRATRALASRRGDLARLKIGVPAFVEALWALVAPDARAARVSDSDATADPPDGAADAEPGDPEPGDPEASPDEAEASGDGITDEMNENETTFSRVDARSRFHALRALIAIVSASWRGAELLVGGAPNTSRGARAPVFHRDLEPLTRLVRPAAAGPGSGSGPASEADAVGDATREKAARLLSLLARTAHGRAALCHEEGANLPDALVAAVEAGARALRSVPGEKDDEPEPEPETENASDDVDASTEKEKEKDASTKRKRRRLAATRVAATCARLLGCLEVSRGVFTPDPAFGAVAIAADAARARAARTMYDLFFRATVEVPVSARVAAGDALARLVAADARVAETICSYGALAAIEAALPAADRLEREAGAAGDGDEAADTLFAEAFGVAGNPGKRDEKGTTDEDVELSLSLSLSREKKIASVPATASFAAAALRLLEALAAHAVARDAARDLERKKKGGTPWAWTLLHQVMPAAGAEADDAEVPPDAMRTSLKKTAEADDAGAADASASSPADDADPAGEVEGEDAGDAEPASPEGEDGDDAAVAAAAPAAASAPASPFPERFERFPPPSSARDGRDSFGTEDAEETKDLNEGGDATRDAPDVDWRALRSRGLASASRLDVSADASSASLLAAGRGGGEDATSAALRFVPGDAPWNDPEVCSAALRALDALARDASLAVSLSLSLPGDGARDISQTGEDVLTSLARDGGAGRRFLEAALFASTRARRFFACVEPAARLLAALAEAEAASAASEPGARAETRDARRGDARDKKRDGDVSAGKTKTSCTPNASSAPRGEKKNASARANLFAGLVLESERKQKPPFAFLGNASALRGVLASALASEPLDLEALPRRPRAPESTAAPPPTPPPTRSRFTPASLRGALLASERGTRLNAHTAAFAAAAPGTVPGEDARVESPEEGRDAPEDGELVEVVTVR